MYEYAATLLAVVDGDTMHLDVDLGCDIHDRLTVRLAHVNAPERNTPAGQQAIDYVTAWFAVNPALTIRTTKDRKEKYGRYLAEVRGDPTKPSLNSMLLNDGHAVPYEGGAR
jgi:endonuclease YncB( thermonuclease family)